MPAVSASGRNAVLLKYYVKNLLFLNYKKEQAICLLLNSYNIEEMPKKQSSAIFLHEEDLL
jgi:hypothetical protein